MKRIGLIIFLISIVTIASSAMAIESSIDSGIHGTTGLYYVGLNKI